MECPPGVNHALKRKDRLGADHRLQNGQRRLLPMAYPGHFGAGERVRAERGHPGRQGAGATAVLFPCADVNAPPADEITRLTSVSPAWSPFFRRRE